MTAIYIDIEHKAFPAQGKTPAQTIIQNFSCNLANQQLTCVVGPSGCGKSTLLNIIAGLDTDFRGQVTRSEYPLTPTISYVFQNPRLLPWKTVRENIELVLPPEHDPEPIDILLQTMGLLEAQNAYPQRLSLGMSRRVALARAFAFQADLLLMDEPFVSLDPATARRTRALLSSLRQQRPHTILFVTHDLREAIELADRLLFLSPSPTGIIQDVAVTLPFNQRQHADAVEDYRKQLLANDPTMQALQ